MTARYRQALVPLVLLWVLLPLPDLCAQEIYSNEHVKVIRLSNQAYLLTQEQDYPSNCLVIAGEEGLMLIDTGFGEFGESLVDALEVLGKPVKVIVNSHAHGDHMGGNSLFGRDVLFIGHGQCRESYVPSGQQFQNIEKNPTYDFEGNLVFFIPYVGGHSGCDILTFIPHLNLAHLGDLFLSESFPLVLIESGSSVETLMLHLNEIFQSLPDNTTLVPGHGKVTSMEYFGGYIGLMEESIELVQKKMKSGWSLQRIQEEDVLKKYGKMGQFFPFITKESWIEQIYLSYSQ
jgi:cyclase